MVLGSAALSVYTYAGSSTSTMNVSVSVVHSCSMDSSPMAFGAYDGFVANASTALEATATGRDESLVFIRLEHGRELLPVREILEQDDGRTIPADHFADLHAVGWAAAERLEQRASPLYVGLHVGHVLGVGNGSGDEGTGFGHGGFLMVS